MNMAELQRVKLLEQQVADLLRRVEQLEQKPKLGRPPKNAQNDGQRTRLAD